MPFPEAFVAGYLAQLSAGPTIGIGHVDIGGGGGNRASSSLLAAMSLLFLLSSFSVGAILGP